jgi:hypothetical protein
MPTPVENPNKMDGETLKRLEEGYLNDASIAEICFNAKISQNTLSNWLTSFPELRERLESLRHKPKWRARMNVIKRLEQGDVATSEWYLERKSKQEFSPRTELTGPEGTPLGYAYSSDVKKIETESPKVIEGEIIKPKEITNENNESV